MTEEPDYTIMGRLQLSIDIDAERADDLAVLLAQFGVDSVRLAAPDDRARLNAAGGDSPKPAPDLSRRVRLRAVLPIDMDLDTVLICIRNRVGDRHIHGHSLCLSADADRRAGAGGQSLFCGDKLCIYPSWGDPPAGLPAIRIDPGLAFGTGAHSTTALCLQWLGDNDLHNKTVIDYGCGTGILAMAAAKLGARRVYATDIDPRAVSACANNLAANKLDKRVTMVAGQRPRLPPGDILIANILLNPLVRLGERFSSLVKPGAGLVLSGLLHVQIEECLAVYSRWFTMHKPLFNEQWALLCGTRNADCQYQ